MVWRENEDEREERRNRCESPSNPDDPQHHHTGQQYCQLVKGHAGAHSADGWGWTWEPPCSQPNTLIGYYCTAPAGHTGAHVMDRTETAAPEPSVSPCSMFMGTGERCVLPVDHPGYHCGPTMFRAQAAPNG